VYKKIREILECECFLIVSKCLECLRVPRFIEEVKIGTRDNS
jgi:hypothetical protein